MEGDLAQDFTIVRSVGVFNFGTWKTQEKQIPAAGVISIATDKELEMVPEGDVISEAKVFYTDQEIFQTAASGAAPGSDNGRSSDILIDSTGERYRVLTVKQIPGSGYFRAITARLNTGG